MASGEPKGPHPQVIQDRSRRSEGNLEDGFAPTSRQRQWQVEVG